MGSTSSFPFPSQAGLVILMAVSLLCIGATVLAMYILLVRIELQTTLGFGDNNQNVDDVALALEENKSSEDNFANAKRNAVGDSSEKSQGGAGGVGGDSAAAVGRRLYLPMIRRAALGGIVAIITFMAYLLLVLSNANVILSWIGMAVVLGISLRQTVLEEVRRERLDRLVAIFSLVLVLAMALNLAVYANRQYAQGDIYEGKARIVGYDYSQYTQDAQKDTILRTDLKVAWGGWWGCPNTPDQTCEAFVAGALCESEQGHNGDKKRRRRRLDGGGDDAQHQQGNNDDENQAQQDGANGDNKAQENNNNDQEHGKDQNEENMQAENEELEKENQELEKENQELKQENQELQDEIDEYKQYAQDEEEEIQELYDQQYSFTDDIFSNNYWGATSWGSVWGEYACEDLFATDMQGQIFDENDPPGEDEWPFVNIYGNCNTCEAFIVDFFSTEHFQVILGYKKAGLSYGILAGISLVFTAFLVVRQKKIAAQITTADKEIELLPTPDAPTLS